MKKYHIVFPKYVRPPSCYKRIYHHIQGFSHVRIGEKSVPVLARDGYPHGEIILAHGKWGGFSIPEPHVGGIDTYDHILAVPSYAPDEWGGFITIYDMVSRKRVFRSGRLAHKCYACGIERAADGGRIIAVVTAPDGSEIEWYRLDEHQILHPTGIRHLAHAGPKNNIMLCSSPRGLYLYEMRAGWPHDTIRRRKIIENPLITTAEHIAEVPSGWCGVRWGATIRFDDRGDYLLKTARNIFRGRLRVVENRIWWRAA